MDWRWSEEIDWHDYSETKNGHLPLLFMGLNYQGRTTASRTFILDSGAVRTAIPEKYVSELLDLSHYIREKTGLRDAHGNELEGVPVPLELEFRNPATRKVFHLQETVWCCAGITRGLLGQGSIFEQRGAIFLNFPDAPEGRRFGVFRPLGSSETLSFHTPGAWTGGEARLVSFADHDVIEFEGGSGLLRYTRAEFADFDLEVDWCAQSAEDKAGVCLRLPTHGSAGQPSGVEGGTEVLIEAQGSEARWCTALRPLGEWNTLAVRARGAELRISLNATEVRTLRVSAHAPRSGGIGLRSHPDSRMRFRALRIRRR